MNRVRRHSQLDRTTDATILERLVDLLLHIRTKIQLFGILIVVAGMVALKALPPEYVKSMVAAGATGFALLVVGQLPHFLPVFPERHRAGVFLGVVAISAIMFVSLSALSLALLRDAVSASTTKRGSVARGIKTEVVGQSDATDLVAPRNSPASGGITEPAALRSATDALAPRSSTQTVAPTGTTTAVTPLDVAGNLAPPRPTALGSSLPNAPCERQRLIPDKLRVFSERGGTLPSCTVESNVTKMSFNLREEGNGPPWAMCMFELSGLTHHLASGGYVEIRFCSDKPIAASVSLWQGAPPKRSRVALTDVHDSRPSRCKTKKLTLASWCFPDFRDYARCANRCADSPECPLDNSDSYQLAVEYPRESLVRGTIEITDLAYIPPNCP
jgi:hypothetical protein